MTVLDGFYLPPGFSPPNALTLQEKRLSEGLALRQLVATPELVEHLLAYVREAGRRVLPDVPVARFVEVLDAAAAEWLERQSPDDAAVTEALVAVTGLSEAMVLESLRCEQSSSRAPEMMLALRNELGDPAVLDGFAWRADARAYVQALGPDLTFCFLPGNIPGLSHLPFMRSLLVKSPLCCKSAASEPVYAASYARTLARIAPELADCFAVVYWPGGDEAIEEVVFCGCDAVIAFGSSASCNSIAGRARPGTRLMLHSHKLGFAVIDHTCAVADDPALAAALARDIAMFDQQACLSPHWVFVEGTVETARRIAEALATALREIEQRLPKGTPPQGERHAFWRAWDEAEAAELLGERVFVHSRRGTDRFLVTVDERKPLTASCLNRAVSVIPFENTAGLAELLRPFAGYFQNAAIAAAPYYREVLGELLARLGLSRICPPGRMATPTMMWHHDGFGGLASLVRYCDME